MKIRVLLALTIFSTVLLPTPSSADTTLTVGVAYDIGGRGDRSFNDASHAGLEKAQKQFDFQVVPVVTDGSSDDREKRIRSLITKDCNPIIAIGSGYAPTVRVGLAELGVGSKTVEKIVRARRIRIFIRELRLDFYR